MTALNDAVGYAIKDTGQKLALLKEVDRPARANFNVGNSAKVWSNYSAKMCSARGCLLSII